MMNIANEATNASAGGTTTQMNNNMTMVANGKDI